MSRPSAAGCASERCRLTSIGSYDGGGRDVYRMLRSYSPGAPEAGRSVVSRDLQPDVTAEGALDT